jgi:hypothetical protein
MSMTFFCPKCNQKHNINNVEKYLGKTISIHCVNKRCRAQFTCVANTADQPKVILEEEEGTIVTSKSTAEKAKLIVNLPDIKSVPLDGDITVIGKNSTLPDVHIKIGVNDVYMSRKHCCILKNYSTKQQFTGYSLRDLGSKNGTWLNGVKLSGDTEYYLKNNDTIRLGETMITFQLL